MPKTIVLLSWNAQFAVDLSGQLPPAVELRVTDEVSQLPELLHDTNAVCLIVEFAEIVGGGHDEDAMLEELRRVFPEVELLVLGPDVVPEVLERRAACDGVGLIAGGAGAEAVVNWLSEQKIVAVSEDFVTGARKDKVAAKKVPNDESSLTGMTRSFSTRAARMQQMLRELEVAARHDVTMLLIGETGSGKTYLSRLIHEVSPRRDEPFLPVACGALPNDLIESEMFGHVKGAFTGAYADKEGKFIAAGRGTILLDEIDVLGPEQQVKLLRVIETGEFEPVGSVKTLKSQARIIVASNLDLEPLVKAGKFRPDLYYRLNMLKFDIPPLRERGPDIEELARGFIESQSTKHGVAIREVCDDLFASLQKYPWPGNVRELENVIQRAVIYCDTGVLSAKHLPPHIRLCIAGPTNDPSVSLPTLAECGGRSLEKKVAATEQDIIVQALIDNDQSRTKTAKSLGISRVTLYNKMKKYGMTK